MLMDTNHSKFHKQQNPKNMTWADLAVDRFAHQSINYKTTVTEHAGTIARLKKLLNAREEEIDDLYTRLKGFKAQRTTSGSKQSMLETGRKVRFSEEDTDASANSLAITDIDAALGDGTVGTES
jgi:hypothetical protein